MTRMDKVLAIYIASLMLVLGWWGYSEAAQTVSLNGTWDVEVNSGDPENPSTVTYTHTMPVPGLVDYATPPLNVKWLDMWNDDTYVWLRKTFTPGATQQSTHTLLKIHKSMFSTKVWLNGTALGDAYTASFTSKEFNVDGLINYGGTNTLVIRIGGTGTIGTNKRNFASDQERRTWVPGVWDDVELLIYGKGRVENVFVKPDIGNFTADVDATIENLGAGVENDLTATLSVFEVSTGNAVSTPVSQTVASLGGLSKSTLVFPDVAIAMDNSKLWRFDNPFLYRAQVVLRQNGVEIDTSNTRFGMRSFEIRVDKDFYLNGTKIILKGGNIALHRFFSDDQRFDVPWRADVVKKILVDIPKEHNFNYVRMHLGTAPRFWYDLADEYGILIADEWNAWEKPHSTDWGMINAELSQWIRENRNHPSIIAWSPMNEPAQYAEGRALVRDYYRQLLDNVSPLDPTRPWCLNDAFEVLASDLAGGYMIPVQFYLDLHPYAYTSNPSWNFNWFLFDFKTFHLPRAATVINEYGYWLDKNGNFTEGSVVYADRWSSRSDPISKRMEMQAQITREATELWKNMPSDGVAPFVYFNDNSNFTSNYFLETPENAAGYLSDPSKIAVKPIMGALKWAFAPFGVALDLWDRHFVTGQVAPVTFFVDNDHPDARTGKVYLKFKRQSDLSLVSTFGPYSVALPAGGQDSWTVSVTYPSTVEDLFLFAELYDDAAPAVMVGESKKLVYTVRPAYLSASDPARNARVAVLDARGEAVNYLSAAGLNASKLQDVTLDTTDVLLIMEGGLRSPVFAQRLNDISRFVHDGGAMIIVEPEDGSRTAYDENTSVKERYKILADGDHHREMELSIINRFFKGGYDAYVFYGDDPNHRVFKDYDNVSNVPERYLSMFNGDYGGRVVSEREIDVSGVNRVLMRSMEARKRQVMFEAEAGNGVVAVTRLQTKGRLTGENQNWQMADFYPRRTDPVSRQYLLNLISAYYDAPANSARIRATYGTERRELRVERSFSQTQKVWNRRPTLTNDRLLETNWESASGVANEYYILDLGIARTFDRLAFYWEQGRHATAFNVSIAYKLDEQDNPANWQHIYSATSTGGAVYADFPNTTKEEHTLPLSSARYIRVDFTAPLNDHYSLREAVVEHAAQSGPEIYFTQDAYGPSTPEAKIAVRDAGATGQTLTVHVTSADDPAGIDVTTAKVPGTTDLFSSAAAGRNVAFSLIATSDAQDILRVSKGSIITATYSAGNKSVRTLWGQENLAYRKPASASSAQSGFAAAQAVDGLSGTEWKSNAADMQWFIVDLGADYEISQARLNWGNEFAQQYIISVADSAGLTTGDGDWRTLAEEFGGHAGIIDYFFDSHPAGRYIKIDCVVRGAAGANAIRELEVYGMAAQPVGLSINSYPATVAQGETAFINVSWNGVDVSQYNLALKVSNFPAAAGEAEIWVEKTFELPAAGGRQTFGLHIPYTTATGGCYVFAFISHKTQGWNGRLFDVRTSDDVLTVTPGTLPLAILAHPLSVTAGNGADIAVSWNNIDLATYNLVLKVSNFPAPPGEAEIWVEQQFELPAASGQGTFSLPIPLSTPAGSCYVMAFINHRTQGWNGRLFDVRTADDVLTVIAQNTLAINSYPSSVTAGNGANINVTWNNIDLANYRLVLKVSNFPAAPGEPEIWVEQPFELPSASGAQTFSLPIPLSTPGGSCYVLAFISHRITGWDGRLIDVRTADDVLTVNAQNTLVIETWPVSVVAGNNADIDVAWNNIDLANYRLVLKVSNFPAAPGEAEIWVEQPFELPISSGRQIFSLPIPVNAAGGSCYVAAFISHRVTGWDGRLIDVRTADDVLTVVPRLEINSYPASVTVGTNAGITLTWRNVDLATYNMVVKISNFPVDPGEETIWIENTYELPASSGTQAFSLPIPTTTPGGTAYVAAFISHRTLGWNGRLVDVKTADDVVTVTGTPLTLVSAPLVANGVETIPVVVRWNNIPADYRRLWVQLENWNVNPGININTAVDVGAASGEMTVNLFVPVNTASATGCRYFVAMIHTVNGFNDRYVEIFSDPVYEIRGVELNLVNGPTVVTRGTTINVDVSWQNIPVDKYDLYVKLENYGVTPNVHIDTYVSLTANTGSASMPLFIPSTTTISNGGRYYLAFVSKTVGWSDVFKDRIGPSNVSVVDSNP